MKTRWIAYGFAFGVAASLMTGEVLSQEAPGPDAEMEQLMKLWEKYALPGPHHRKLEVFTGTWEVTTKMWMEGADAPPAESKSTSWCRPIFGGRFIESKAQGTMSFEYKGEVIQVPTESVGYIGYDSFKEKYVLSWIHSGGTGIYYAEGTVDETGKVFTYFATYDEWETGRRGVPYKMVDRIIDENTIVSSMYDLTMKPDESKVLEMVSKRAVAKQFGPE
ncbi:MAG: DUF1579 family protein [Planctomycetota bacterium]